MPWSWTSTAKAAGKDKGKGKGGGGNGSQTAAGSGGAAASSWKQTDSLNKANQRIAKLEAEKKAATQAAARAAAAAKKHWTCTHCGDTKCFATRKDCHACGKPRVVPTPPGLEHAPAAAAAADQEMVDQEGVPLEERIGRLSRP